MAKNAIVYGNGESRREWDITRKFKDTETWGCNRIEILLGTEVSILQFGLKLKFSFIINS